MKTKIIRWVLETALVYGVYTETGIWTALAMVCVGVGLELAQEIIRNQTTIFLHAVRRIPGFTKEDRDRAMFGKFHDHPDK